MVRDGNMALDTSAITVLVSLPTANSQGAPLRGEIELLCTGERRFFANPQALLALLERWGQEAPDVLLEVEGVPV
jgi:hypothetical protein